MLLYENAWPSNYDEIKTWYPVWYRDVLEMDALWQAWGEQLDGVQDGIIQAVDNNFLDYCDFQTIVRLENFLSIKHDATKSEDERRRAVKAYFISDRHIGRKEIKDLIAVFTDGLTSEVEFAHDAETGKNYLNIYLDRGATPQLRYSDVHEALSRKLPAHLRFVLMVKYNIASVVGFRRTHYLFNYERTGTKPDIATLGDINAASVGAGAARRNIAFPFAPASEAVFSGKLPADATLGDYNAVSAVGAAEATSFGINYPLCGTRAAGI